MVGRCCDGLFVPVDLEEVEEMLDLGGDVAWFQTLFLGPFWLKVSEHSEGTETVDFAQGAEF